MTPRLDDASTAPRPESALLVVNDLHRDFGGVLAVNGASFDVQNGSNTALIGPNGAGKTTVLTMVAGAMKPTAGSVRFDGREIARMPSYRVARLGLIRTFQISSEFARLTVLENLLVGSPRQRGETVLGALRGKRYWRDEELANVDRARGLLKRFDMSAKVDDYAGDLSGGQKRLLEIMRALMAEPKLLLLDEPMAGVNPSLGRRIEGYLTELRGEGLTILMVEHELGTVERLCDRVIVMAQGKVISHGSMAEVRSRREVLDAYLIG